MEPGSLAVQAYSLLSESPGKPPKTRGPNEHSESATRGCSPARLLSSLCLTAQQALKQLRLKRKGFSAFFSPNQPSQIATSTVNSGRVLFSSMLCISVCDLHSMNSEILVKKIKTNCTTIFFRFLDFHHVCIL